MLPAKTPTPVTARAGQMAPSAGDVLVCGESVAAPGGPSRVRLLLGVCPQFDTLWGELSGLEHLLVAGHIRGLRPSQASSRWTCGCIT